PWATGHSAASIPSRTDKPGHTSTRGARRNSPHVLTTGTPAGAGFGGSARTGRTTRKAPTPSAVVNHRPAITCGCIARTLRRESMRPNKQVTGRGGAVTRISQSLSAAAVRCTDGFGIRTPDSLLHRVQEFHNILMVAFLGQI